MTTIKARVIEKDEERKAWEAEKQRRQEERQKLIEEQQRKEDNRRKREEEMRQKELEKQKKWEDYMLQKLDIHPFISEIDQCDHLIRYCLKNQKKEESSVNIERAQINPNQTDEERKKAIEEALNKGKLMRAPAKEERLQQEHELSIPGAGKKKGQKKDAKGGNSMYVYEDDDSLNLDFLMIQKFS